MRPAVPASSSPLLATRAATEADLSFLGSLHGAGDDGDALAGTAVVELDGVPIGALRVRRGARCWTITRLQLLPPWRGAGIGSRLIAALLDEARAAGVGVGLSVLKSNPALALYERMGFVVTDECENGYAMQARP